MPEILNFEVFHRKALFWSNKNWLKKERYPLKWPNMAEKVEWVFLTTSSERVTLETNLDTKILSRNPRPAFGGWQSQYFWRNGAKPFTSVRQLRCYCIILKELTIRGGWKLLDVSLVFWQNLVWVLTFLIRSFKQSPPYWWSILWMKRVANFSCTCPFCILSVNCKRTPICGAPAVIQFVYF